jgi:hypothetical protein
MEHEKESMERSQVVQNLKLKMGLLLYKLLKSDVTPF